MKNQVNVQHIKNYFGKPIVLIIALLSLATIILGYIISAIGADVLQDMMDILMDLAKQTGSEINYSGSISTGSSLNLTAIASIVGWLLIYFMSKSRNPETTPAAGLMIFSVLAILGIVGASLILLLALILIFVGIAAIGGSASTTYTVGGSTSDVSSSFAGGFIIGIAIALLIAGIIMLFISILELKFYNAARKSMKSPFLIVAGKGYGVFSIIAAIFTFLGVASLLSIGFYCAAVDESALEGVLKLPAEIKLDQDDLIKVLNSFGVIMIISSISSLVEGVNYCLKAKLAFGYCSLAKNTPAQPINTPYGGGGYNFYGQENAPVQQNDQPTQVYGDNTDAQPNTNPYGDSFGNNNNI